MKGQVGIAKVADDRVDFLSDHYKPKKTTHARGFTGGTVEAEAISASVTRRIVREAVEQHLDLREVEVMEVAEDSERAMLNALANTFKGESAS